MKISEIMDIPVAQQTVKPQSPGARGLKLNKHRPAKRWFDTEAIVKDNKTFKIKQ